MTITVRRRAVGDALITVQAGIPGPTGAPGLSAAQQAFDAGEIDAPTEEALAAWLAATAEGAAAPAIEAANTATQNANAATQAANTATGQVEAVIVEVQGTAEETATQVASQIAATMAVSLGGMTSDVIVGIAGSELVALDANGGVVFNSAENREDLAALAARETVSFDTDVSNDYPDGTLLVLDGAGGLLSATVPGAEGGPTLTAADLTGTRDDVTKCVIPRRFLSTAERPTIMLWLQGGQSLAIAGNSDDGPFGGGIVYTSTPTYPGEVLMLNGVQGVRAVSNRPFTDTGLTDAIEVYESTYGESGMVGFLNRLHKLAVDATGVGPMLSGIVWGAGGTPIEDLRRGTDAYDAMLGAVERFVGYADNIGCDVMVAGVRWIHGNASIGTSRAQYARFVKQMRIDIDTDVRFLTGQVEPVLMYCDQVDSGSTAARPETGVPLAQLDVMLEDPHIRALSMHADIPRDFEVTVHPSSLGYLWMGERDARLVFKDYFCGGQDPFRITSAWRTSTTTVNLLIYTPETPLVIDTSGTIMDVSMLGAGVGFEFDDGSGAPPAISAVTLVAGSTVEWPQSEVQITLASPPTGPSWRVFHAMRVGITAGGGLPRTAIRDSASDVSTFGVNGLPAGGGNPGRPLVEFMHRQIIDVR